MNTLPVFRCDPLRLKLTIAACADNYRVANGTAGPVTASSRGPRAARAARLGPCQGCKTGAVHAETGKARNGLRLEVLQPRVDAPCAPAPAAAPAFDDVVPGSVPAAATVAAPGAFDGAVSPRPAAMPRPARAEEESTMRKSRPDLEPPKSERLTQLKVLVEKLRAAKGYPKRMAWPTEVVELALRCAMEERIPVRVVADVTAIHETMIFGWVRHAKKNAGAALDAAVDEAPAKVEEEVAVDVWEADPRETINERPANVDHNEDDAHTPASNMGGPVSPDLTPTPTPTAEQIESAAETAGRVFGEFVENINSVFPGLAEELRKTVEDAVRGEHMEAAERATSMDEFIELCDRLRMPYRLTDAVLRIVAHHFDRDPSTLAEARFQLKRVAARKAAA